MASLKGITFQRVYPRQPVVLCLDTSSSMGQVSDDEAPAPIDLVAHGLNLMYKELCADERGRDASDIYILAFGGSTKHPTTMLKPFGPITEWTPPSELVAKGKTFLGTALLKAKELLEQRVKWYKDEGLRYYEPWIILMTDGRPSPEDVPIAKEARTWIRSAQGCDADDVLLYTFFACEKDLLSCGVAQENLAFLRSLYPDGQGEEFLDILTMDECSFDDFFQWVSHNSSRPGKRPTMRKGVRQ